MSKALARRAPGKAPFTNDNYVCFAMARWMQKTFGRYPNFPLAWDPSKSYGENWEREKKQPGWRQPPLKRRELASNDTEIVKNPPIPTSHYPDWYQSMLKATYKDPSDILNFTDPDTYNPYSSFVQPIFGQVVCDTSDKSASALDCDSVFEMLYTKELNLAQMGKKGSAFWEAVRLEEFHIPIFRILFKCRPNY